MLKHLLSGDEVQCLLKAPTMVQSASFLFSKIQAGSRHWSCSVCEGSALQAFARDPTLVPWAILYPNTKLDVKPSHYSRVTFINLLGPGPNTYIME